MESIVSNSIFRVTLDEITPEKLIEIETEVQNSRLVDLTIANLKSIGSRRHELRQALVDIENECRARALRAIGVGVNKKQLAEYFGVSPATINSWTKGISDV